jgi:protoporphyrinogen oxidase
MREMLLVIGAGLAGLVTFGFLAKKYGSDCTP